MDWRDRYETRQLVAAAVHVGLLLIVLTYGLWPASLGLRVFWPTVGMLPAWAAAVWLTLHRPWDWERRRPRPLLGRAQGYSEPLVVFGVAFGLGRLHWRVLRDGKETDATMSRPLGPGDPLDFVMRADDAAAWANDTLGWLILDDHWIIVGGAAFLIGMSWFLLPR